MCRPFPNLSVKTALIFDKATEKIKLALFLWPTVYSNLKRVRFFETQCRPSVGHELTQLHNAAARGDGSILRVEYSWQLEALR